jgi:hypothetical protein
VADETRDRPTSVSSAATMLPSSPQLAPRPAGARASTMGAPPSRRVFFSCPSAKKPIHCPSGAKNDAYAPSVPGNGVAIPWSSRSVAR